MNMNRPLFSMCNSVLFLFLSAEIVPDIGEKNMHERKYKILKKRIHETNPLTC